MNLQLYSNTTNKVGGKNYNNDFTVTLPEQIDAENEIKTIRVLNVTYPLTVENVSKNSIGVRFTYIFSNFRQADVNIITQIRYDTQWIYIPAGHYSIQQLVDTLNYYVDEYDMYFSLLSGGRIGVNWNISNMTYSHYNIGSNDYYNVSEIGYVLKSMDDVSFEFSKTLSYMLGLDEWVINPEIDRRSELGLYPIQLYTPLQAITQSLIDMNYITAWNKNNLYAYIYGGFLPDITNGKTRLFIYCDEVVPTIVGDTRAPLLTNFKFENDKREGLYSHNVVPIRHQLIKNKIQHLHIRICDAQYNLVQFSAGTVGIECIID